MKIKWAVWAALLVPFTVCFADVVIDTKEVSVGKYHLIIEIKEDGSVSVEQIDKPVYFTLKSSTTPPPPPTSIFGNKVKNLLSLVVLDDGKAKTAKGLSTLYKTVAEMDFGDVEQVIKATNMLYTPTMVQTGKEESWKDWKNGLDTIVEKENFSSVSSIKKAWLEIAKVLEEVG
jgi:hypothetical protein